MPADAPLVPMRDKVVGLTSVGKLLSHDYLRAKVEVKDGDFTFVPSEGLTETLLDYYEGAEFKDSCAYDALIAGLKDSWDAHYPKKADKLTHKLLRRELGKSPGDGWKLKLSDLEASSPTPTTSCRASSSTCGAMRCGSACGTRRSRTSTFSRAPSTSGAQ